jgi:3-hydroxyisobutyrate dehydrogenase-like beta-hydroxyacid dehydrogenase
VSNYNTYHATGYPMAKNLRAKLPSSDQLFVYDKNEEATSRFAKENQGVEVATSVRHVAERSVCQPNNPYFYLFPFL